ncbi:hypothetical protein HTS61_20365 [Escherichia coli]|nr:hypothetical protein [Escherichia coli]
MIYLSGDVAHVWIALPPKIVRVWWLLRWPPRQRKIAAAQSVYRANTA